MRLLGRLILLVVGCCLIGFSIPVVIQNYKDLTVNGWDFQYMFQHMELVSSFVSQIINISFGLTALIAALFGRASFGLLFTSVILVGGVVWFFYTNHVAGTLTSDVIRLQLITSIVLPIGYFVGTIFLFLGRKRLI